MQLVRFLFIAVPHLVVSLCVISIHAQQIEGQDLPRQAPATMVVEHRPYLERLPPVAPAPQREAGVDRSAPLPQWAPATPTAWGEQFPERLPPLDDNTTPSYAAASVPAHLSNTLVPWWYAIAGQSRTSPRPAVPVDLSSLIVAALQHSQHVAALRLEPQIREEEITRAVAAFDTTAFLESRWNDISEPVTNQLTTGGPPRFNDHFLQDRAGLRKRTELGGTLEWAQEINLRDNNSRFLSPRQQALTRMVISYNQPLLRQNGREYNRSLILLAETETEIGRQQVARQLQDHIYQVIRAYWTLYLQRALLLQRQQALEQAQAIHDELQMRSEIDVLASQLARARAAIATRRSGVLRAMVGVRNAEAQIASLTNAPEFQPQAVELLPQETPAITNIPTNSRLALQWALSGRPEVNEAIQRAKSAQIRLGVARNELLPTLNLVLEGYVNGLDGNYDVGSAYGRQFSRGAPSYSAGLLFAVPLGNRAAEAAYRKRQLELAQVVSDMQATLAGVHTEVENAIRDSEAAMAELQGRYEAMIATREEVDLLVKRWRSLPGDGRAAGLALEDILDSQDRLLDAEQAFAQAQFAYMMSLTDIRLVTGTLLQFDAPDSLYCVPAENHGGPR